MIRPVFLAALLASVSLAPVLAQPVPFDMSPESGLIVPAPPEPSVTVPEMAPQVLPAPGFSRHLLPGPSLRLAGEDSRQAVVFYLTAAQAEGAARLQFSYLNAVVVAPEFSSLNLALNQTVLGTTPIASSAAPSVIALDVPAGVLRAGANVLEIHASQRHRTDCTIESTYELWTELRGDSLTLNFADDDLSVISQLPDLGAVGVDSDGRTTLRLITGDLRDPQALGAALQLTQQLAIALRVAELHIELADALSSAPTPGVLDLVLAPAEALPEPLGMTRGAAAAGPLAAMVNLPGGANTLVVSGPDWAAIGRAGAELMPTLGASSRPRVDLGYPVPMLQGGQSVTLSSIGAETVEFNGRRFTNRFQFELPADFYAYRYGDAELVLDAAYSADVLPGSEIDIYTNGQIASATPLLQTDGGLLRNTIIRIPMTNLRPGRNEVDIAVHLNTRSDAACPAGWTGQAPTRFVFSGSSQLRLPDYARAAALPDLRVLTGTAWPYADRQSVPIVVGEDEQSAVAAMMLAARIATASGKVIPFSPMTQAQLSPALDAVLVKPMPSLDTALLARSGLAGGGAGRTDAVLDRFVTDTPGGPWTGPAEWLLRGVGLELRDLRIVPFADAPHPVADRALALAQARQPEGGLWTLLTAADASDLRAGAERLIVTRNWRDIAGRVSTMTPANEGVTVVAANNPVIEVSSFSPANLRFVAANWFSGNILMFTALVASACVLLMLATSFLLGQRRRGE